MLRNIVIASLMFVSACSKDKDPRSTSVQDQAFSHYVRLFESIYGKSTSRVSMGFSKLEFPTVGRCKKWSNGYREIEIDPDYWNSPYTTQEAKIGLIFHELGHCELNRYHDEVLEYYSGQHIRGEIPRSLMYPYNFYSSHYAELQNYYFAEMFTPSTNSTINRKLSSVESSNDGCVLDLQ